MRQNCSERTCFERSNGSYVREKNPECLGSNVKEALDAADIQAETTSLRYSHNEVFGSIKEELQRKRNVQAL